MNAENIRSYLYQKYIDLGGVIEKTFILNADLLPPLYEELMVLKNNDLANYYEILKVFLLDCYGYLEEHASYDDEDLCEHQMVFAEAMLGEEVVQTITDEELDELYELDEDLEMESDEEVEDEYSSLITIDVAGEEINIIQDSGDEIETFLFSVEKDIKIMEIMEQAANLAQLDELLTPELLQHIIDIELCVIAGNVNNQFTLNSSQFNSISAPYKIQTLAKFFSQSEIEKIFSDILKKCVEGEGNDELLIIEMFANIYDYCWSNNDTDDEIVTEIYKIYLNILEYYQVSDHLIYDLCRTTYFYLLKKMEMKDKDGKPLLFLDERIYQVVAKLSAGNYNMEKLRSDFVPAKGKEYIIPEMFRMFVLYALDRECDLIPFTAADYDKMAQKLKAFDECFGDVHKLVLQKK